MGDRLLKFLEVAVPLPLFKTFTYRCPGGIDGPRAGCRVIVPFGSRVITGLVVERHDREPKEPVKPIRRVLDNRPLLSPQLMKLGRWITEYYFSPPGEAFRVMLPPGLLTRKSAEVRGPGRSWPAKRQLAVTAVLRVTEDPASSDLTGKQAGALAALEGRQFPVFVQDFARKTGFSAAVIRALERKGWIRLEKVDVLREPWGDRGGADEEPVIHTLTVDQVRALGEIEDCLDSVEFNTLLLHGVTGSGKTEVYLRAISKVLANGRSALMLVPEIGLTPQVSGLFRQRFGAHVAIQHSGLSDGERFDQWRQIREGKCRVVVGTRSAVFAPVQNLGIIVVDEEHDTSYKQEELPRYNGRDTALMRGKMERAPVVLGSATPQLETFYQTTERKRFLHLSLPNRILDRRLPTVHIVDMRTEFERLGKDVLVSGVLSDAIHDRLRKTEQVLLLLNRRGYSSSVICRSCGHVEACRNCSISLTFHLDLNRMICHYCGFGRSVPGRCRECDKEYIHFFGVGTQKAQEIVGGLFPGTVVERLDRDTTRRKGSIQRILASVVTGRTQILVGTQMIAKGHDFPNVTLVGVLAADQGLRLGDFRAAERTFQLLTQVAGRAGRGSVAGEVVVQTYYPEHYSLKYACAQAYDLFYQREIVFRSNFRYPPYTALANLMVRGEKETTAEHLAEKVAELLSTGKSIYSNSSRMRVLGPAPAAIQKLKREFRFQILVKTTSRRELQKTLQHMVSCLDRKELRQLLIDVDPVNLI